MKNKSDKELFSLLVRVYNHSIQSYFYFPDVIIYGRHRLEKEEFHRLVTEEYIDAYHTDSFGKLYQLNKKADAFLQQYRSMRKRRTFATATPSSFQSSFSFSW